VRNDWKKRIFATTTVLLAVVLPQVGQATVGKTVVKEVGSVETQQIDAEASLLRMHQAAGADTAQEAVEIATDEILALIRSGQQYAKDDPQRFYSELEELMRPVLDFERFARSVMGVWYKKASKEQFAEFSESFKWTLVQTYALALTEFYDGQIRILPEQRRRKNPNQATVSMEITYRDKPYQVVYAMERRQQKWGLVNIVIEGINLRLNYRSQFDSAMKGPQCDRDIAKVLAAWSNVITADESAG